MYPELTLPLVAAAVLLAGFVIFLVVFRPVLRRLALRQVSRRPGELMLVVAGSLLGTALIVASLTVGDSLDRSVRQTAYDSLGQVDEYVRSPSAAVGDEAAFRLGPLRQNPDVDGVLTMRGTGTAASVLSGGRRVAEPRVLAWELDFGAAARFGAPHRSGLAVANPGPGRVVVNGNLATSLGAKVGDRVTFYGYGRGMDATISAVVPATGLGGIGVGAAVNRDAFFLPGTLSGLARQAGQEISTTTFISNRGGVEDGARLTGTVSDQARGLLGPLAAARGADLQKPKQEVLDQARQTGDALGSLFLFVASFSIIAGILLIVNIFVMLIEERKGQLGVLRAIGMRRRRVSHELMIEGSLYTVVAVSLGGLVGLGIGRIVVALAVRIFNGFNDTGNQLSVIFAVTPTSMINGIAAGFLIALLAVTITSVRIARTNIISAIRDLAPAPRGGARRRSTLLSAAGTVALVVVSVPVVAHGVGMQVYLLPALAVVAAVPLLRRFWPARPVHTAVGLALFVWGLIAHLVRPHLFDDASTGTFIVQGCMLTFASVLLISQHQDVLLYPLRRLMRRPSQTGLATRLAVAYPTAKRFQTGATLAMYCIVIFVVVLLTQISAIIDAGVQSEVTKAAAGWSLRADHNPAVPWPDAARAVTAGPFAGQVAKAATLVSGDALADDPLRRTAKDLPVVAVGLPDDIAAAPPALNDRLSSLPDDAAAWRLVLRDPSYVLIDTFYGATGGPQGKPPRAGSKLVITDPQTGRSYNRTVAGILTDGIVFYGVGGAEPRRYPVLMSQPAVTGLLGTEARPSSLLLRLAPGADVERVGSQLQGQFLAQGMVTTDLAQRVRDNFTASQQFFTLMRGYLALGLLIGVTGLGVIMVRAVRERRRTIAVLRALGFQARTVRSSFYAESTFVAFEGVVIGTLLGVLTTWLLYQNSPSFGSLNAPYPIAWTQLAVIIGGTLAASLLATVGPARRAARIRPAIALRISD
ncbi:ABC transporter permease [Actinomadura barringtoniae]|uniref:ABC transporter permease n=1 Tax=Actinomadura barringtoniae TaxID=1427535 RepID=A0A939PM70_9ACTN|nr:ABC transporter permease [Actinomadura barringtoniae]MBO2455190.1 ABC transporter permease [Actinomadura barringtoniae]